MKVIAAYLLALLGGNASPSAQDIRNILGSVGASSDEARISLLLSRVEGMEIDELLRHGLELLGNGPVTVPHIGISSGVTENPGSTCESDTAEQSTDISDAGLVIRSDLNYVHYKGSGSNFRPIVQGCLKKLPIADQFRFRSVHSGWKLVSEELFKTTTTAFPLVLFDCKRCDHLLLRFTFYSAAVDDVFSVEFRQREDDDFLDHHTLDAYLSNLDRRYSWLVESSGAVGGWLFISETLIHVRSRYFAGRKIINCILNPFSGQSVILPCLKLYEFDFQIGKPFFYKTVVSCPPGEGACFVAAIGAFKSMLGFCRPGDSGWFIIDGAPAGFTCFSDLQFHSDGFLYILLGTICEALVFDLGSLFPDFAYTGQTIKIQGAPPNTVTGQTLNCATRSQRRLHISCPVGFEEQIGDSYLVRSIGGDILLVRRLSTIGDMQTFRILQLLVIESEAKWVDVFSTSGDESIFISGFSPSSAVSFSNMVSKRLNASSVRVSSGMPDCYYTHKDGVCFTPFDSTS